MIRLTENFWMKLNIELYLERNGTVPQMISIYIKPSVMVHHVSI